MCQQVFSAAFIAHIEVTYDDEKYKNEMCVPIPHPDVPTDYIRINLQTYRNSLRWLAEPKTAAWLQNARLDWFRTIMPKMPDEPAKAAEAQAGMVKSLQVLVAKLENLLDQLPEDDMAFEGAHMAKARL
jgi:hypothetical protein